VDDVARWLASPVSRRRALRLGTGAFAAMAIVPLRPRTARAQGGYIVCSPENQFCFAFTCPVGTTCCPIPDNHLHKHYCPSGGCCDPCNPNSSQCGSDGHCGPGPVAAHCNACAADCKPGETECDGKCCNCNQDCVVVATGFFSDDKACMRKCPFGQTRCPGVGGPCIKAGAKCPEKPGFLDGLFSFGNNDSAGTQAGNRFGQKRAIDVGTAAASPLKVAELALAAVATQGSAVAADFVSNRRDSSYRRAVIAHTPSLPKLPHGPGLSKDSAAALDRLIAAETKAFGLLDAASRCRARARAAEHADDSALVKRQIRAASRFADKGATALKRVPARRLAAARTLRATGAHEVTVTADQVARLQADIRTHGLSAPLRGELRRLGVGRPGLELAIKGILRAPPSEVAGPILIAPLEDQHRSHAISTLASDLASYARATRSGTPRAA
jgi:hypothetical protein